MTPREAIARSWTDHLTDHKVGLGLDLATSTKGTANPSSISVTQKVGRLFAVRLVASWKTENPDVTTAMTRMVIEDIRAMGIPVTRLCVDASNEVFYARTLKKELNSLCHVELIKGQQKVKYQGEEWDAKTLLGNLYINAMEDGLVSLPAGKFIFDDQRLVKTERGSFQTDLGKNGQHGDTFDSTKLSVWAHIRGAGKVEAQAVDVTGNSSKPLRKGLVGSLSDRFRQITNRLNA